VDGVSIGVVQLPIPEEFKLPVHIAPVPSFTFTVTLPVGTPTPGGLGATVKLIVTICPTTDGLGVLEVIIVDVLALITV
jgi:hypothetical protein